MVYFTRYLRLLKYSYIAKTIVDLMYVNIFWRVIRVCDSDMLSNNISIIRSKNWPSANPCNVRTIIWKVTFVCLSVSDHLFCRSNSIEWIKWFNTYVFKKICKLITYFYASNYELIKWIIHTYIFIRYVRKIDRK